jgi:predicted amidohydrolase
MPDFKLNVAVAQIDCALADPQANLNKMRHFTRLAAGLGAAIVIFPECSVTGYFIGDKLAEQAEAPDGASAKTLADIAKESRIHLAVGMFTTQGNSICNSQLLFSPEGRQLAVYNKAHLFSKEREFVKAGDKPVVVDTALGKIGMTICYDLIFPDYIRKLVSLGADFIINSTNWINDPWQRDIWGWEGARVQGLVSTRALENVTVLAMANRVGHEVAAPGIAFDSFGHSTVAGHSGKIAASIPEGEGIAIARIDESEADLERWRSIATYRGDRRPDLYR